MRLVLFACCLAAHAASAQGTVELVLPSDDTNGTVGTIENDGDVAVSPLTGEVIELENTAIAEPRVRVQQGDGAVVRWLDKVSGMVRDIELSPGQLQVLGRIEVTLGECRYPANNPSGDAYAWLDVQSVGSEELDFSGWMLASSPALSALDHPRYDVWVIRCTTT